MTTHSTIRNVLRLLVASFFAACLFAMWPLSAEARGNNHVEHHDITIKKTADKSSPAVAKKKGTTKEEEDEKKQADQLKAFQQLLQDLP